MKSRLACLALALPLSALPWGCAEEELPTGGGRKTGDSLVDGYRRDGSLPMLVSANGFDPSGYMGDGGSSPGSVRMDTNQCLLPRGPGAAGACYKVTYAPGPAGWAGVYWQYPKNNWGASKGRPVEAGARKLTFYAASRTDSLEIEIAAGGVNPYLGDGEFQDGFRAQGKFMLSTAWVKHTLAFDSTAAYAEVIGGFCWSLPGGTATQPLVFWLDDIKWEK
jgi:hypothetical protein